MEKLIITNDLNNINNKYRKVFFYLAIVLAISWFVMFFSNLYQYSFWDLVTQIISGFIYVSLIFLFSKKHFPWIELDGDRIKANLPGDLGVKNNSFDIAESDVIEIQHKVNVIKLQLKNGETKEINLSRFGYSDVQKVKAYFDEVLEQKMKQVKKRKIYGKDNYH